MTIWEFIKLRVASDFTIAIVCILLCLLVYALVEFVKFSIWYHDHRKGKF